MDHRRLMMVIALLIIAIGFGGWYVYSNREPAVAWYTVEQGNVTASKDIPAVVSSSSSVDLSFQQAGRVISVSVSDGQTVKAGQTLAIIDSSSQQATLAQEKAALAQAQANYQNLIEGATPETIQTAQDSVASAQQSLDNAYAAAADTINTARLAIYNAFTLTGTIQNAYFFNSDQAGVQVQSAKSDIAAKLASTDSAIASATGDGGTDAVLAEIAGDLQTAYQDLSTVRQQCDQGAYYSKVSAADKSSLDSQKSAVNTQMSAISSLQQNIASLKVALQKAKDELSLTKAPPTQAQVDAAKAAVQQAQAAIDNAQVGVGRSALMAPFSGVVQNVTAVRGLVVSPGQPVLSIVSNQAVKIDAYAPETDIPFIQQNAAARVVLDPYGAGVIFPATVSAVDAAETTFNNQPAYHITLYVTQADGRIRAGMTGDAMIVTAEHNQAIQIPARLVLNQGNNNVVLLEQNGKRTLQPVTLGLEGDTGMVEVTSGLQAGNKIADF